jgi:hypothetical protein
MWFSASMPLEKKMLSPLSSTNWPTPRYGRLINDSRGADPDTRRSPWHRPQTSGKAALASALVWISVVVVTPGPRSYSWKLLPNGGVVSTAGDGLGAVCRGSLRHTGAGERIDLALLGYSQ